MTTRERFQAIMHFRRFDRLPVLEWAEWWDLTLDRWRREGLPPELTDRYQICRYFDLDMYKQHWFHTQNPTCPHAPRHGAGILTNEREYEKLRAHLYPRDAVHRRRWSEWAAEQERGETVLWFTLEGFFWFPRTLLGIERHMLAFYDLPGLLHRINEDLAEWMSSLIEELCAICTPDFMTFAEDMSYNKGPMLSEALFDEFLKPYYLKIIPQLTDKGILPFIDSDGDISDAMPWFRAAGIQGVLPLERSAGVDVPRLRAACGDMRFIGHFDKKTMSAGEAAMRAEFERLLPAAAAGGFIPGCDHQTPPEVSLENYTLYLSLFREYAVEAGHLSQQILPH